MAKSKEKLKALILRRDGWSIGEIAKKLHVSRGSVSIWCSDIELTLEQREVLQQKSVSAGHTGRLIGAQVNKKKKEDAITHYIEQGRKDIGLLTKRDLLIAGVALYWGEGSKTEGSKMAFVNSDPTMILFMRSWFKEIAGVSDDEFMPRIFINQTHRSRIKKVLQFWSSLLELPIEQFGKPIFLKIRHKKRYENHDTYQGVLQLGVRKSTHIKYKLLGLIEAMKK